MAQNYVNTGTQSTNREDYLMNFLADKNYKKAPLFKMCKKEKANDIVKRWTEDTLHSGQLNGRAEGFTPSFSASDNDIRVPRTNNQEIIARLVSASRTMERVNKVGLGEVSEYEHQLERKSLALTLDANITLWQQVAQTRVADSGTAGQMAGYFALDDINTINAGGSALTIDLFNQLIYQMLISGVDVDTVFCNGYNKRMISSWMAPYRQYTKGETEIVDTVQTYRGDWGVHDIIFDKDVPVDSIACTAKDELNIAVLEPYTHIELGKTKDAREGMALMEFTFRYGARKALGSITGLAVGS